MKKRADLFDTLLNLLLLILFGVFVDRFWFSDTAGNSILFDGINPQTQNQTQNQPPPSASPKKIQKLSLIEKIERKHLDHLLQKQNQILILKKEHKLFIIDEEGHKLGPFSIAIGKNPDLQPKQKEGDKRTPEGEYFITSVMDENHPTLKRWNSIYLSKEEGHHKYGKPIEDLGKNSYGPNFLMLNYPNAEDRRQGRTGSGIGIHGTNDPDSIGNEATSGCIRMTNKEIIWLSQWLKRGTPVKIEHSSKKK